MRCCRPRSICTCSTRASCWPAAEAAWRERELPLASVEALVRQVLSWREFMRGLYWLDMPRLAEANHWDHGRGLPAWYWSGNTRMACLREVLRQTLARAMPMPSSAS
jgi:deoxyribodipyrimidine photolyase-related protein